MCAGSSGRWPTAATSWSARPGRLRDHLERGRLDTSKMRVVVLDEADEMLDLGFREDLEFILDATPEERRTLLFSATLPKNIAALARRYQRDALRIDTLVENEPHGDIEYRALRVAPNEVEHAVVNVLRFYESRGALVFCHTREAVRHLHASLLERGFSAVALSGELTQNERSHALQALRDGRARVCVATDVAARGIDLPDLGLVIHADLPNDHETLLHRSGRTGRAGRKGICVLLVPYTRRRKAERLVDMAGVDVTWAGPPSADEIRLRDRERLMQDPIFTEETTEEDLAMARALLAERSAEEIANALVRFNRSRLPAPEEIVDAGSDREPRQRKDKRERTERAHPRLQGSGPGFVRGRVRALLGRHGVVPHERRPAQQRRSPLAPADHLPPRPRDEEGDRLDQDLRPRDEVRDRQIPRAEIRLRRAQDQRRGHPHRAGGSRPGQTARCQAVERAEGQRRPQARCSSPGPEGREDGKPFKDRKGPKDKKRAPDKHP